MPWLEHRSRSSTGDVFHPHMLWVEISLACRINTAEALYAFDFIVAIYFPLSQRYNSQYSIIYVLVACCL